MFLNNIDIVLLTVQVSLRGAIISQEEPAQRYLSTAFCATGNTAVTIHK
jgi:hypothetical protein